MKSNTLVRAVSSAGKMFFLAYQMQLKHFFYIIIHDTHNIKYLLCKYDIFAVEIHNNFCCTASLS